MENFADRLLGAIEEKGNPCVVGLDPRIELMPAFIQEPLRQDSSPETVRRAISRFHRIVLDATAPVVPAVKPQSAFYEQYGIGGLMAFADTIHMAKERGLLVIADAKRSDIASTAQAYADTFLGRVTLPCGETRVFDADSMTVSPFLGRDSLVPFVRTCAKYGKGIFVLVKTSNPGSVDIQNVQTAGSGEPIYLRLARMVDELGRELCGKRGYSAVGAVVGATFPEEAAELRLHMPRAIILVPGYGAQGGTADDVARCFNPGGCGAVVSASRSITYSFDHPDISEADYVRLVRERTEAMIADVLAALHRRFGQVLGPYRTPDSVRTRICNSGP